MQWSVHDKEFVSSHGFTHNQAPPAPFPRERAIVSVCVVVSSLVSFVCVRARVCSRRARMLALLLVRAIACACGCVCVCAGSPACVRRTCACEWCACARARECPHCAAVDA